MSVSKPIAYQSDIGCTGGVQERLPGSGIRALGERLIDRSVMVMMCGGIAMG